MRFFTIAIASLVFTAGLSFATPLTLKLDDGTNSVTVQDGGAGDSNSTNGAVTWIRSLGVWTVNVSTGIGYPLFGSPSWPYLDLNSVNTSTAPGTLTITLTQGGIRGTPTAGLPLSDRGPHSGHSCCLCLC